MSAVKGTIWMASVLGQSATLLRTYSDTASRDVFLGLATSSQYFCALESGAFNVLAGVAQLRHGCFPRGNSLRIVLLGRVSQHLLKGGNCDLGYESVCEPVEIPKAAQDFTLAGAVSLSLLPSDVPGALLEP
eukprot:5061344-Amphidinium_carterae.1